MKRWVGRAFTHTRVNYLPTPGNTTAQVFNFSPENEKQVELILSRYPSNYRKSAMIPLLFLAQKQNGNFLSLGAMQKVAEILDVPPVDVYEVASFYTMFNREPVGRFHLQVCGTTPCMVCGADKLIHRLEHHLGIHVGETTADGLFTLSEVECLGACVNAPMLQLNNEWVYEDLNEESVVALVDDLRAGRPVTVGPQNHRKNSEGPAGRTSLNTLDVAAEVRHDRDFAAAKEQWQKAKEEAAQAAKAEAAKASGQTTAPPPANSAASPAKQNSPASETSPPRPAAEGEAKTQSTKIKEADKVKTAENLNQYTVPRVNNPAPKAVMERAVANDAKETDDSRKRQNEKPSQHQRPASVTPDAKVTPDKQK